MGIASKKRGSDAEEAVLAELLRQGHTGQIQKQRCITLKNGTKIYPDPQGCDILGGTATGRAMFIEVKSYSGASIPISQKKGIKLRQIAYMADKEARGFTARFALVMPDGGILFVPPSAIVKRGGTSYLIENAHLDHMEIV